MRRPRGRTSLRQDALDRPGRHRDVVADFRPGDDLLDLSRYGNSFLGPDSPAPTGEIELAGRLMLHESDFTL